MARRWGRIAGWQVRAELLTAAQRKVVAPCQRLAGTESSSALGTCLSAASIAVLLPCTQVEWDGSSASRIGVHHIPGGGDADLTPCRQPRSACVTVLTCTQVEWDGSGASRIEVHAIPASERAADFTLSAEDAVWVDEVEEAGRAMKQPPGARWAGIGWDGGCM